MSESASVHPPALLEPDERLQGLWQQGQRPNIEQFLGGVGGLSIAQVLAVLLVDQRQRWESGERLGAEKYLALSATFQADLESTIQLIYGEFLLREELGEQPTLEEYVGRFPAYAER